MTEKLNRRALFGATTAAATALVGTSALAQQETAPSINALHNLVFQSAFPKGSVIDLMATRFAEYVNEAGGNKVQVKMLPVNAVAKTADIIDAVNDGRLDGAFDFPPYWYAKRNAIGLWGASPTFGMDGHVMGAWHYYGGGKELLAEVYKSMGVNVVSFPCVSEPTQPLGWFNRPIARISDFQGINMRIGGLAGEVMQELGVKPVTLPGGEISSALKGKRIDAAEWNDISSDRAIDMHNNDAAYCLLQSFHEASTLLEVMVSGKTWANLPPDVQAIIENASHMVSESGYEEFAHRNAIDYEASLRDGVNYLKTPKTILIAQLNAWDRVIARKSAADPLFGTVAQSQRDFAKRAVKWKTAVDVDYRTAYLYFRNSSKAA